MASINLGRVGFVPRGTWSSDATYNPLDVVLYNGTSYVAKTTSTGLAPSTASAAWQELIQLSTAIVSAMNAMAVRYDATQSLTSTQKGTGRDNIGAASASDVTSLQGRMTNAEGDIADIQADMAYTPMALNSFTVSPTEAEMGSTVTSVSYAYSANKVPATLKIDGSSITAAQSGSGTLTVSLTETKTWTMTATDTGSPSHSPATSTKTATLTFMNRVYYGVASIPTTVNSTFVTGLANKVLSTTRARTITLNVTSGNYAWYASPTRLGSCTFKVGGFDGGFEPAQTVSVTNASGYTENYYVYRSTNPSLGSTSITIS